MLKRLQIKNYALIEQLDLELTPGFSIITGETGAGKSIILGALGMILGQRADTRSLKQGARRCVVEATFDLDSLGVKPFFDSNDLDYDEHECIIRRELSDNGKSRAFINDTPVSLSTLKELSAHLIDIHSQHQNLLLNQENFLLSVVDAMADNSDKKHQYHECYQAYRTAERQLQEFRERVEREQRNMDFLQFQVNELDELHLQEGEQASLEEESEILSHAEGIKQGLYAADHLLSADEAGITSQLYECQRLLQNITDHFKSAQSLCQRLDSCAIEVEDIAQEVNRQLEGINFDPERQVYVDDRLNAIYALEKKHRCSTDSELLQLSQKLHAQLEELNCSDEQLEEMQKRCQLLQTQTLKAGEALTATRKKAAQRIEVEMTSRLQQLGMPHVHFSVRMEPLQQAGPQGLDQVAFFFNANRNQAQQNLADIASGGEMARVMLSLKALLTSKTALPTIIFDEIDTGVSGHIAEQMALMMKAMSHDGCQVVSITHLPQIAALGDTHFKVYKEDSDEGTATHISRLNPDERITEIAHMLSGAVLTDAAINNAKELLKSNLSHIS